MCQVHARANKNQRTVRAPKIAEKWKVNIKIFMKNVKQNIICCMNFATMQLIGITFEFFSP